MPPSMARLCSTTQLTTAGLRPTCHLTQPLKPLHPAGARRAPHRTACPAPVLPCLAQHTSSPSSSSRRTSVSSAHAAPSPASAPLADAAIGLDASGSAPHGLTEYILRGPLLASCGLTELSVRARLPDWAAHGRWLATQMRMDHDNLSDDQRLRIYHYYLPVFFWVEQQLEEHRAAAAARGETPTALVLGISAPQGCGKSTLVESLEGLFNALGRRAAGVSIDDFYLTFADQSALGQAHPDNPLLQYRGNAGSHDLRLGADTLAELRSLKTAGASAALPRYDKSQQGGRGDRAPRSAWPVVEGPLDLLLFEGWMTGFSAVPESQAAAVDPSLVEVNRLLQAYPEALDRLVDSWLVVRIEDPEWVFKWRLQAEVAMKATGRPGMTDQQVSDFVLRYMPAYRAYLPGLYASGPVGARAGKTLVIEVDASRAPVQHQKPPPQLLQ